MDLLNNLIQQNYITYDEGFYIFEYVGIILVENRAINCYPKYLPKLDDNELFEKFKIVLQVIRKYNKSENIEYEYIESDQVSTKLLPLMLFFIEVNIKLVLLIFCIPLNLVINSFKYVVISEDCVSVLLFIIITPINNPIIKIKLVNIYSL